MTGQAAEAVKDSRNMKENSLSIKYTQLNFFMITSWFTSRFPCFCGYDENRKLPCCACLVHQNKHVGEKPDFFSQNELFL